MSRKNTAELILTLLSIILLFSSCSMPDGNIVTLRIPTELPIVDISKESPYMDLYCFDGWKCSHRFIRSGETEVTVPVRKGVMTLFTLTPYGKYSSVSSYYEPDMTMPTTFSPTHSQLIQFYTDVALHNPELIADTSMSSLVEEYPETDRVDKMKLLEFLEKGSEEDEIPDLAANCFDVEIETYIPGRWISDRSDMNDFSIPLTGKPPVLKLYEGVYHYFHEDGLHHLMIVVTDDGRHSSRLDYTIW